MDSVTRVVYYAICTTCGRRPWSADFRSTHSTCDECGRGIDHWQPTIERKAPWLVTAAQGQAA